MPKNKSIAVSSFLSHDVIVRKIYLVRGEKVMLDRALAELYHVETRVLNQAVRRHMDRFPSDFMFTLTRQEIRNISQSVISLKFEATREPEGPIKTKRNRQIGFHAKD